jgi:hypothetical protein
MKKNVETDRMNSYVQKSYDEIRYSRQPVSGTYTALRIIFLLCTTKEHPGAVSQSSEKDSIPANQRETVSGLSTTGKTTTDDCSKSQSTLQNNKWQILAQKIKLSADLKSEANEKRNLRNARRWKL